MSLLHPYTLVIGSWILSTLIFFSGVAIGRRTRAKQPNGFADFYRVYRNEMNRR